MPFSLYQYLNIWAEQDSNLRRTKSARFTVWCHWPLGHLPVTRPGPRVAQLHPACKLAAGIEPATSALQKRCSAWLSYASGPPVIAERVSIGRRHKCCKSKIPYDRTPFLGISSRLPPLREGHIRTAESSSYSIIETAARMESIQVISDVARAERTLWRG
jgi:hypothetical protein